MSRPQKSSQDSSLTIIPDFDTNLGCLEVDESKTLKLIITCSIPKVKVICEQQTSDQESEVETKSLSFQTASTKNLTIKFKANIGGVVVLVIKVEKLKGNKTHSNDDLKVFEQRFEFKYQTNLSNIDIIPENEIKILKRIGKGGEATIYKALYNGEVVAIKTYEPGYGITESEKMLYFRDKYIVEYKKSFYREIDNKKWFCSMLEYAKHGSLENVKHLIEQSVLYKIMEDICRAVKYLHNVKNVIHRDIKPQNILIFNYNEICNVNAKLTDFGTCELTSSKGNSGLFGTDYFMAPEVVKGEKYSNKCDIYSLGITMLNSLLKIDFNNSISDVEQENGTYIKTTAYLKTDVRDLIYNCCQIDPLKRPDIDKCLISIKKINKTFGDKEVFGLIDSDDKDVRFSLPKFNLLESIKEVVQSIKELKVTNDFIKALLMLKFNIDSDEVLTLINNVQSSFENKGDIDYALTHYYSKKNDPDLINKIYELMISAANKSHPDAIMYLVDILLDIDAGKIIIYDEKNNEIREIVNDIYDLGIVPNKHHNCSKNSIQHKNNNAISTTLIINIFSVLRKYLPICEFQYGFALLHGIGTTKNFINAEAIFNNFKQSGFCNNLQEVEFYQAYCKFINNNIQNTYKEAYDMLNKCITYSEEQDYYSYALNNMGVLLYKGLGCEIDINKAFEYFKKSMKLNNNYGKFNYAFCLCEEKQIFDSESIEEEDGNKTILELANNGFGLAQHLYALAGFINYIDCKKYDLIQEFTHWFAQASLQFDYHSISKLGATLRFWSVEQNDEKMIKCKEIAFKLFNIADQNGELRAKMALINCYEFGEGTEKNLEKAKNYCENILKDNEFRGNYGDELKAITTEYYFRILKKIYSESNDQVIHEELSELLKLIKNNLQPYLYIELGKCYYDGILGKKDINKAVECFEKVAKDNKPKTLFKLGEMFFCGDGVDKDENKAIECFEKIENMNDSHYLFEIGVLYLNRNELKEDISKAIEYFEKAAKLNDPFTLYKLGNLYISSDSNVNQDIIKGITYFIKAANLKNLDSFYALGIIFIYGCRDKKKGFKYLKKAANLNHQKSIQLLEGIDSNKIISMKYL